MKRLTITDTDGDKISLENKSGRCLISITMEDVGSTIVEPSYCQLKEIRDWLSTYLEDK